jgi:drug/metabolite transporter (DMT)-like permease
MKIVIVVAIAALSAAIGESLMSVGMRRYGVISLTDPAHLVTLILSVVRNPYVFLGVVFLAFFFFLYLAALSWADLSYVLPLTAMSYIFAALMAKFVLKEDVSWQRWLGTVIIVIGVACVAIDNRPRSVGNKELQEHPARGKIELSQRTVRGGE